MEVYVLSNGVIYVDSSNEPPYNWHIAGGPALRPDTEPSQAPLWVTELRRQHGILGKNIGIYRLVGKDFPSEVWKGILSDPIVQHVATTAFGKPLVFKMLSTDVPDALNRLTFGAFGHVLDPHLKSDADDFWDNHQLSRIGFVAGDYSAHRFFNYLFATVGASQHGMIGPFGFACALIAIEIS
jgi:hypothetical protein